MNRYTISKYSKKGIQSLKKDDVGVTCRKAASKIKRKIKGEQVKMKHLPGVLDDIKISVIVPLYNTNEQYLKEMIESVKKQHYKNWELCLADGSDDAHSYVGTVCRSLAETDKRIKYKKLESNTGIAGNTNECVRMATGEYIALLDHDDFIDKIALEINAWAISNYNPDVLYSDEDHYSVDGHHINFQFKPDWSADLLYSQMYICHLLVIRKELFWAIGGFNSTYDGAQDYDLMLRLSEKTQRIMHIPAVLYSWRESETSTAANADSKPYANEAGRSALDAHLKRRYGSKAYAENSDYLFVFNPRFELDEEPMVSIIIPMKDKADLTDACVKSICEKTHYSNYEIIILNNRSEDQETFEWFDSVQKEYSNVRVIDADMEFNWSALNNFGIHNSDAEVYVFLNNDTLIISEDWLDRLTENALRDDIGAVGGLLLYEDGTIQHAGVVVGFGGWADHVFKGMKTEHFGSPFVSPMVSRNVLAVTGACMAISKKTIDKIGLFDESFTICGSDVEICVRAYKMGLNNRYDASVKLYHLESKSRDSYIPPNDFERSAETYAPFVNGLDPYYNCNFYMDNTKPSVDFERMGTKKTVDMISRSQSTRRMIGNNTIFSNMSRVGLLQGQNSGYAVGEVRPIIPRSCDYKGNTRINLIIPSLNKKDVFGGIATALNMFDSIVENGGFDSRIILVDADLDQKNMVNRPDYMVVSAIEDSDYPKQIVEMNNRSSISLPVGKNDVFMATGWWTAYMIERVIKWQSERFDQPVKPLVYMVQDYEPGFYAWSSRYAMADSTYHMKDVPVWAIINSKELNDFLVAQRADFEKSWYFEPTLNENLKRYLPEQGTIIPKKKKILVYGRPGTARNAFEVIVEAVAQWAATYNDARNWEVIGAGEDFGDINVGNGVTIKSVGKLSLDDYAQMLLDCAVGISLMVSPHPSYPPLEMAAFGIKTVTNNYSLKDLSGFSENIINISYCSSMLLSEQISCLCRSYQGYGTVDCQENYISGTNTVLVIAEKIAQQLLSDI